MRRTAAIVAATCSMGLGGMTTLGAVPASAAGRAQAAPAHATSCVYGKIGGVRKCLRAGEYCARRYRRQYVRYGFTCSKRDRLGDWHLEST